VGKLLKLFVCLMLIAQSINAGEKYYFIIRVDDILSRNTSIVPRSITPFEEAVAAKGAKVTWLVMPHRLIESTNDDGNVTEQLINTITNGHEIAMHGYDHICDQCGQSSHEMYCTTYSNPFSYQEQSALIRESLRVLQDSVGVSPRLFVPPGHHADTTTYSVLLDQGFDYISTTSESKVNIHKELYNLGMHNEFTWSLTSGVYDVKLYQALDQIKTKMEVDEYFCMLFHDPFIRAGYENGIVIDWTKELIDSLNSIYGDKIEYITLSEAADIFIGENPTNIAQTEILPKTFALEQNYPNPFNPTTTINYTVGAGRDQSLQTVQLIVYDQLGRQVATLVNQHETPGRYSVKFNGVNLSSGMYYYSLSVGEQKQTKKMILIK
jgi:predicted deacetylase